MIGRLFRAIHRLAIGDASRSGTVQTDENSHEQSKKSNFERMTIHHLYYGFEIQGNM